MATSVKDTVIYLRKKLERTSDDDAILKIIHKLSKVPVTLDILQGTNAGKMIRTLAKKEGIVGTKACSLLNKWREVLASPPEKQTSSLKENTLPKASHHSSVDHKSSKTIEIRLKPKHSREKDDSKKESRKEPKEHKHLEEDRTKERHSKEAKSSHREHSKHSTPTLHKKHRISETDSQGKNHSKSSINGKLDKVTYREYLEADEYINDECYNLEDARCSDFSSNSVDAQLDFPVKESKHSKSVDAQLDFPVKESKHSKSVDAQLDFRVKESKHSKSSTSSKSSHSKDNKTTEHIRKNKPPKDSKHKTDHQVEKVKGSQKGESTKSVEKLKKLSKKMKLTEEFTSSEISFEDCLSFNDIVPKIKKRKSAKPPPNLVVKKSKISSKTKHHSPDYPKQDILEDEDDELINAMARNLPEISTEDINSYPEPSAVDISSTLPQTQPNYRPLPHRSYETSPVKKKVMSNEEAIKFTTSRREKTAVYSGRKNCFLTSVPTLFECCTRVLIENIDDIEYMGEIPYFLLESMLERCSATQLYRIEHFNPYLLEDTNVLWEKHCKRDYRCAKLQDSETWRELYWRSYEEQERRLKSVTANISASIASSNPTRKAKLAYVDSYAKPPRDVARRQAKHGTALPVSHAVKVGPPSKASPRPTAPAVNAASTANAASAVCAASTSRARVEIIKPMKPKIAPLMAKTLKSMKQCFRR